MPVPPPSERGLRAGVAAIAAAVVAFYALIGADVHQPYFRQRGDYYPLLVDGFRAGHLSLAADPPPALARLANPYDPAERMAAGIEIKHDTSYYQGRYYLYFGVAPAVVLFWPFRALTGVHLSQNLATVLLCAGGYLASLGLVLGLRRRYFPRTGAVWAWLAALMLGLGNFCPPMLARNSVWEVPIAAAYCFSSLALWLLFRSESAGRARAAWLAGAGTALGLSVGSRPQFVLFCAAAAAWWAWGRRRDFRAASARIPLLRDALALLLPLAAIGAGLALYNYERFGSFGEFGQRYQLGGFDVSHVSVMGPRFVPINFYNYFWARAQFQRYFPFVQVIHAYGGASPANYAGAEDPYGILPNLPFCWIAFAAPLLWRRRRDPGAARWLALFGAGFLIIVAVTLGFVGSTNRYMVDFLPFLLLAASLGLLMLAEDAPGRRLGRFAAGAAVVYSALFSVFAGFNHNGLYAEDEPAVYSALARFFNAPVFAWEAAHPPVYGPMEVTLRFPMDRPGAGEPLLVTGVAYRSDFLYVVYDSGGQAVQLGFSHTNYNQRVSPPIPVDYRVPHTLGVRIGSLYPARGRSYFAGWKPEAIEAAKRTITVTLDGVPYFTGEQDSFDATPGLVRVGANDVSAFVSPKFTGQILALRRGPLPPAIAPPQSGEFVRLGLAFPGSKAGRSEPLVATGGRGRGDLLFIQYQHGKEFRLGFAHSGRPPEFSPPLAAGPGDVQLVEASLGSLYAHPADARERELQRTLAVRLNGRLAWVQPEAFYPADGTAPVIGTNAPAAEGVDPAFTGRILAQGSVRPLPPAPDSPFVFAPYWLEMGPQPAFGAVRLRLGAPETLTPPVQPLLTVGPSWNQADYVAITRPAEGQIAFDYAQFGIESRSSRRLRIAAGAPLTVEMDLPSLYPAETDPFFASRTLEEILALKKERLRLRANGQVLADVYLPEMPASADQVSFGENRVSAVYSPRFLGKIQSIERLRLSAPDGFEAAQGPLEFRFTAGTARGTECLLATGPAAAPDALLLVNAGPGRDRLVVRMASGRSASSETFDLGAAPHALAVEWGGLDAGGARRSRVSLTIDGRPILQASLPFQFGSPQRVAIGSGPPGAAEFSGVLHSVRRRP